ncbi:hypothetical protein KC614_02650 [candidate division WWE3 bacterium]|uniref:2'-deoxynucleoside 5'-phosphate N-hydrolase 1 n=1 Tax=candidate division WWE3 bacterium TaxID=2053526 RepID=A0A955RR31_UNCKA|nr:hypothetical protein [candidate division WWE3 bacterium]
MKIFFIGSAKDRTLSSDVNNRYEGVVKKLKALGHTVEASHVLGLDLDEEGLTDDQRVEYYKKLLDGINTCDTVVADISNATASIGHQITIALEKNKPVLGVTVSGVPEIFKMLQNENNVIFLEAKNTEDILANLEDELRYVKEGEDIRFNFLIPPSMVDYLEWISKTKRIPKSVFLRDLITREMDSDNDYKNR